MNKEGKGAMTGSLAGLFMVLTRVLVMIKLKAIEGGFFTLR